MDLETELVFDTLYNRIRGDEASCFSSNVAGLRLLRSPAGVIPAIEKALRETVEPALSVEATKLSRNGALEGLLGSFSSLAAQSVFPGLDYLLGAYLVIGARTDFARVARFLLTASDRLLVEAISAVPTFFRRVDGGYNFGVSPEGAVAKFVIDLSSSERNAVRTAATRVVQDLAGYSG